MTREDSIVLAKTNKKRARHAMGAASLLLFASSVVSYTLSALLSYLYVTYTDQMQKGLTSFLTMLGTDKMNAFSASRQLFSSGVLVDVLNVIIVTFAMVIPSVMFAKAKGQTTEDAFNLKGKLIKHFIPMFCLCQLFTSTVSVLSQFIFDFVAPAAQGYTSEGIVTDAGAFALVMSIISTCVFVPVAEEFLFRGVILSHLKRYGLMFGAVASATLFGVAHSEPVQSVFAFTFGLLSALIAVVTGNIKTSILFHSANNLVSVLIDYFGKSLDETTMSVFCCLYYIALLFFAFVGMYHLSKKDGFLQQFKKEQERCEGTLPEYAGMKEMMCVSFVIYITLYAVDFVLGVFGI